MYFFISLVAFFLGFSLFILFTPFVFEIDSTIGVCSARITGLICITLLFRDESLSLALSVLGWKKVYDLLAPRKKSIRSNSAKKGSPKKANSSRAKRALPIVRIIRFASRLLATFHVDIFQLNLDTGDWLLNSLLFPFAFLVSRTNRLLRINYNGDVMLKLRISNNLARILPVFVRSGIPIIYLSLQRS